MATAVTAAISRIAFSRTPSPLFLAKRLLSSSSVLHRLLVHHPLHKPPTLLSQAVRLVSLHPARFNSVGYATLLPSNLGSMSKRWFIYMKSPFGKDATLQQLMDYYIQTLAKVVGSEKKAKKKIYRVSYLGFGCEIDIKTLKKFGDLQGFRYEFLDDNLGKDRYDLSRWLVIMDASIRKKFTIDSYIQTLAKVVGSEKEAKKKIYSVLCRDYFGFGCEIDVETAKRLDGLFCVRDVFPDYMVYNDEFVDWAYGIIEPDFRKLKLVPTIGMV